MSGELPEGMTEEEAAELMAQMPSDDAQAMPELSDEQLAAIMA